MPDMMNTREVADYLRIKERKVYDLVAARRIPCSRVTGKWLFPKALIDRWVAAGAENAPAGVRVDRGDPPPVVAGSADPLLEWAVRESGSGLAVHADGSLDGLRRLAAGEAAVCGLHVIDPDTGAYNVPMIERGLPGLDVVAVEWARRTQALLLAPGNPLGIAGPADLAAKRARVVRRQADAGAQVLLEHLLAAAGLRLSDLETLPVPARTEMDLGLAVLEGRADAGLGALAVGRLLRLEAIPLAEERFDLVMRRRDYFEPPVQALLAFARGDAFRVRAAELGGYDVAATGAVRFNGP
ncbi:helix-turn-helix transcriptional regulator [Azospirillum halopraeferens]|uniref:helix-turn-helix transcriptional regulator n=1 Tax=Azospirillum halopraeferens TaxID=34010 RepID=UPI000411B27F|nr:helix-turn-helix transcriptional regulator [Azospirillum halopraeferens]